MKDEPISEKDEREEDEKEGGSEPSVMNKLEKSKKEVEDMQRIAKALSALL